MAFNTSPFSSNHTERPSPAFEETSIEAMRVPNPSDSRSPASRFSQTATGCFAGSFARYSLNSATLANCA